MGNMTVNKPISAALMKTMEFIEAKMQEVVAQFHPGAKFTLLIRQPGDPEADLCLTTDDPEELDLMMDRVRERQGRVISG